MLGTTFHPDTVYTTDCKKNVVPNNKKTLKTGFILKIQSLKKLSINVVDKYTKLFKPNKIVIQLNYRLCVHIISSGAILEEL